MHECPYILTRQNAHDVARLQVEDDYRETVVHAQGDRGRIHDLQSATENLEVGQRVEALCVGIELGIRVVHAVDAGGLQDRLRVDLERAKRGGGVGREVGVAGTPGEDHDATFLEVADG